MLNIICVDDNYLFLTSFASLLKENGYNPILTTNPKTALLEMSTARRNSMPIHVMLTDFHFSGYYNASELCNRVLSEFPSVHFLVLTADRNIGMDDFKYYKPKVILNKSDQYQETLFDYLKKIESGASSIQIN